MGNGMLSIHCLHVCVVTDIPQIDKREDPYAPQQSNGCCIVM